MTYVTAPGSMTVPRRNLSQVAGVGENPPVVPPGGAGPAAPADANLLGLEPLAPREPSPLQELGDVERQLVAIHLNDPLAQQNPERERLVAAFDRLHGRARDLDAQAPLVRGAFNSWVRDNVNDGNVDANIPPELDAPYSRLMIDAQDLAAERVTLLNQWEVGGFGGALPLHGLDPEGFMAPRFDAQRLDERRALRATLLDGLLNLQARARATLAERQQLEREFNPGGDADPYELVANSGYVAGHAGFEQTFLEVGRAREDMLRRWDQARLGVDVPEHGLTPDAGLIFQGLEQLQALREEFYGN